MSNEDFFEEMRKTPVKDMRFDSFRRYAHPEASVAAEIAATKGRTDLEPGEPKDSGGVPLEAYERITVANGKRHVPGLDAPLYRSTDSGIQKPRPSDAITEIGKTPVLSESFQPLMPLPNPKPQP